MTRPFSTPNRLYDLLLLLIVFGTDWTIGGASDLWLLILGMFCSTTIEALLLSWSTTRHALRQPGWWSGSVAAWAISKAQLLILLLIWAAVWEPPDLLLAGSVAVFRYGHELLMLFWPRNRQTVETTP